MKVVASLLCVGVVLALPACGDDSSNNDSSPAAETKPAETPQTGTSSLINTDAMVEAATNFCRMQGVEGLAKQFKVDPSDVDAVVQTYVNFGFEKKYRKYGLEGCRAGLAQAGQ